MKYLIFIAILVFAFVEGNAFLTWSKKQRTVRRDCIWTDWVNEECIRYSNGTIIRRETRFKIPAQGGGRECNGSDYVRTSTPCTYAEYFGQEFMRTISQGMIVKPVRRVVPPNVYKAAYMPPQDIRDYVCSEPIIDPQNRWKMSGRACRSFPTRRRRKRYSAPENLYPSKRQTRDVLFLIDESKSVGPKNFKKILNLVVAFISQLCGDIRISSHHTKVALTSFDTVVHDHLRFNEYIAAGNMARKIQNIRYSTSTQGNTCLVEALRHARMNVFNSTHGTRKSDDVYGMIILVTDGCANCKGNIAEEVREFRRKAITFMLVTVGDETGCAKATSKLVNADHCYLNYEMANWDDFDSFVAAINSHVGCQSYWDVPDETCSPHSEPK